MTKLFGDVGFISSGVVVLLTCWNVKDRWTLLSDNVSLNVLPVNFKLKLLSSALLRYDTDFQINTNTSSS